MSREAVALYSHLSSLLGLTVLVPCQPERGPANLLPGFNGPIPMPLLIRAVSFYAVTEGWYYGGE